MRTENKIVSIHKISNSTSKWNLVHFGSNKSQ